MTTQPLTGASGPISSLISPDSADRDDATRRVARILQMIKVIHRDPYRWTRRRLAARFEISERMITKDLYLIRYCLGLPLNHDLTGYWFSRSYDPFLEACNAIPDPR